MLDVFNMLKRPFPANDSQGGIQTLLVQATNSLALSEGTCFFNS